MRYFDERYADMPVFGSFFGGTFSLESAMRASPDIIIDMGMPLVGIAADLDALQEQTGIPVIFIEATLGALADAYDTLGEILDLEELSSEMSLYIRNVLDFAEEVRNKIPMEQRLRVLYTQGEFGEDVFGRGSVHSEVLEYVGVYNVANIEAPLARGIAEVSMEQIMLWNPDIVILGPNSFYDDIWHDRLWAQVAAVQSGRVYEVPIGPYDWLNRPPSVQRILGIQWLGSLIYPQYYDFDIIERVQEFYRLFFRYELSADEARSMMANSIFKDRTEPSAG
jgi:iron complex transport system substrate-binding protein